MNNRISLYDYLETAHRTSDYQDLFYGLHHEARILLESYNAYVPYLTNRNGHMLPKVFASIQLNWMNARDVTYLGSSFIPLEDREEAKKETINFLVTLASGFYLGYDYQNGLLNRDFLEANFASCQEFYPEEDKDYYESVLVRHEYLFYDEYMSKKKETASSSRGVQMVKGGTGYHVDEGENEKAAYANSMFLTVSFFIVAMVTMALVFLFVQ